MPLPKLFLQLAGKVSACLILFAPLGVTYGQSSGAESTAPVTFTFAPPLGTKLIETRLVTRDKVFEGLGKQSDRSETRTSIAIDTSESGYVITAKPIDAKMTRNGKPHDDLLSKMMVGAVVTYHIDHAGRLTKMEGIEDLLERIESSLPAETAAALKSVVNEEAMLARETAEWNGRIGDFVGATVEIGDVYVGLSPFSLPNGETITFFTKTTFPSFEPCPAGTCIWVRTEYDSDSQALGELAAETVAKLIKQAGGDLDLETSGESTISGTAARLMDPATMNIHAETRSRTMKMTIEIPGKGLVPITMTEVRDYSFEYQQ